MKRIRKITVVVAVIGLLACGVAEILHYRCFGHFVGYGIHVDVILGNSDVATNDMYYASLLNAALTPFDLEGCKWANDTGGDSIMYRWNVQKRDAGSGKWLSLRSADAWVPNPFDGNWKEEPCRTTTTRLWPFQTLGQVAWVYKDWVTTGVPVRMAIHTSVTRSPLNQRIVYTDTFVVKGSRARSRW